MTGEDMGVGEGTLTNLCCLGIRELNWRHMGVHVV